MTTQPHAIIVGAGIGGMAAGIALRRIGWSVSVYTRATDLRPVGAGLSLWANAVHALDRLGLRAQLQALLPPAAAGGIFTWRGESLAPPRSSSSRGGSASWVSGVTPWQSRCARR